MCCYVSEIMKSNGPPSGHRAPAWGRESIASSLDYRQGDLVQGGLDALHRVTQLFYRRARALTLVPGFSPVLRDE